MNVQSLFCINFGRDSKPGWTDEQQIDDDECADGRNERKRRRNNETNRDGMWAVAISASSSGVARNIFPKQLNLQFKKWTVDILKLESLGSKDPHL